MDFCKHNKEKEKEKEKKDREKEKERNGCFSCIHVLFSFQTNTESL